MAVADSDNQAIVRLTTGLSSLTEAVGELRADLRENTKNQYQLGLQFAAIQQTHETLAENFKVIVRLVRDGNGQPSLLQRVGELEAANVRHGLAQRHYADAIDELRGHLNEVQTARVLSRGQLVAGLLGMVITALMSLGAILAQLLRP